LVDDPANHEGGLAVEALRHASISRSLSSVTGLFYRALLVLQGSFTGLFCFYRSLLVLQGSFSFTGLFYRALLVLQGSFTGLFWYAYRDQTGEPDEHGEHAEGEDGEHTAHDDGVGGD
jgi:hypothetical protein